MDYLKLAKLLYPNVTETVEDLLKKFPKRDLPEGAEVMRFAPSPTGFFHIGGLYSATMSWFTAKKTNGVFYFRLEDTDTKREIKDAGSIVYNSLCNFGIVPDEGYRGDGKEQIGNYGSYIQSQRVEYYKVFAKELVKKGRAFPCFCEKAENKEEILNRRAEMLEKENTIEEKDPCRNLTLEQIEENLKAGKPYALRLKSMGNPEKAFILNDLIRGKREVRENAKDTVLVKSNGIPPYALAHVVDDTLMHTTTVVRGEEWYASVAQHIEIFKALDLPYPNYAHTPVICKIDEETGNKRKLSKRKDKESDAAFYFEEGYPKDAVVEYVIQLLNSDFEAWRAKNPTAHYSEFDFKMSKIGSNNPMFDVIKLNDISKTYISKLTKYETFDMAYEWAVKYDKEFAEYLLNNKEYVTEVLNIDREKPKPRKDLYKWSMLKNQFSYMFVDFKPSCLCEYELEEQDKNIVRQVVQEYAKSYNQNNTKEEWFENIKILAGDLGFATDNKLYKANPSDYKGNVADFCLYIRLALTGRKDSPDLFTICSLLGKEKVSERLNHFASLLV